MKTHKVRQGECLSSIADENGFFWQTIWDHPDNESLKELRKDPNILQPGDTVAIPDKRLKEISEQTSQVYKYRVKNTPAKFRVRLLRDANPRSGEKYVLTVDGVEIKRGSVPSDGNIEMPIPPKARTGELVIGENEDTEIYTLNFGYLDPIETVSGVKARLNNLGFDCGTVNEKLDEETIEAIFDFQCYINHSAPTGDLDDQTRQALAKLHDEVGSS